MRYHEIAPIFDTIADETYVFVGDVSAAHPPELCVCVLRVCV